MFRLIAIVLLVLFASGFADELRRIKAEAIQRGYALHCPQTGDFAWKGECDGPAR